MIIALLVVALAAVLAVALQGDFNRLFRRSVTALVTEQGQAYLRGAEQLAGMALKADWDRDKEQAQQRDDLTEIWAQQAQPYALDDGGWLVGSLEDLQGRFNLNALAEPALETGGAENLTAAQQQFIRLLQALGEPAVSQSEATAITRAIGDWLDNDSNVAPDGAEDDYYSGRTPGYRAANRPMASPSELLAVAHVTPALYRALAPWVTVWPADPGKLNIHTAPAMLLRTLNSDNDLSPLSEAEGEALVQYRAENGFIDINDLLEQPVFEGRRDAMSGVRGRLDMSSNWFLLRAEAQVAGRTLRLYSVLERRNRAVNTVLRVGGSL